MRLWTVLPGLNVGMGRSGSVHTNRVFSSTRASVRRIAVVPLSTTVNLPDNVKKWVGPFLAAQVKDTFEAITAGKRHGDLPH